VDYLDLAPIRRVSGTVRLPGSKSISNRILLLAALASGKTRILDLLDSDDTRYMLDALRKLGVDLTVSSDGSTVEVNGTGGVLSVRSAELYLGNAGTAFRPLTAVLAFAGGEYKLSGLPRMHERPIKDLVDALRTLGANIDYLGNEGYPPLAIHPAKPVSGSAQAVVSVRGDVSSQFLSALMMAAPLLGRPVRIAVEGELISKPYVRITLNMMKRFGVSVVADPALASFEIEKPSIAGRLGREAREHPNAPPGLPATEGLFGSAAYTSPTEIHVEGDASSASYFLAAGAISGLTGGGPVRVEGAGRASIQGDVELTKTLEAMGAKIEMGDNWISATAAPDAIRTGKLRALDADLNHIPDAAMVLAVAALYADGPSTLRNIGSWRVKETDRIAAMATELRKLGAVAIEGADWLRVEPPARLQPATIDTYEDHRIAMSFSLAALGGVTVRINDPGCVAKTFPDYFRVLDGIVDSSATASPS
jgi:3-phosphoshikimate 1-carboxyvinyltransferase